MDATYPGFGSVVVAGVTYNHDVVIDGGRVRARDKGPSRASGYGHTPLSALEDIPWSGHTLVVGTGASGRLPILQAVVDQAAMRGIELITLPTEAACELLATIDEADVHAVLHVTC